MRLFFAHFLFVLAAWTVVIKYLFPMTYALAEGLPLGTYVYLDLRPVVHVLLGRSLLRWHRYTFEFAIGVSIAEIGIIVTKFVFFLSAPQWTIWQTNWFINKIFVLACFTMLLIYLIMDKLRARGRA